MRPKKKSRIITFILIILFCVVILYSTLLSTWRYNEKKTIENTDDIENTIEMDEHVSTDDLSDQMLVEESNEAKEFDGVIESDKAKESDAAEESDEAVGAARVFNHWLDFSGTSFSEELSLPYVDDETFEAIKAAYEQIDFFGEFQSGNQEVYDEYKEKYKELLENDGLVFDPKEGMSVPFSQIS